ncbi:hypothetical protein AMECASPLE_013381 [Ameca splendens]|uniref:Uncharacterized protein n=1 Tax=Ameca splendens TaxID=208324 RepID=A0ABV0ZZ55_9TELE
MGHVSIQIIQLGMQNQRGLSVSSVSQPSCRPAGQMLSELYIQSVCVSSSTCHHHFVMLVCTSQPPYSTLHRQTRGNQQTKRGSTEKLKHQTEHFIIINVDT